MISVVTALKISMNHKLLLISEMLNFISEVDVSSNVFGTKIAEECDIYLSI